MGGGTFGNRTATGEFNIWADPEAAAIVFESGVPMVMAGLDVTHQFQATPARIAAVRERRGRLATVLGRPADVLLRAATSSGNEGMTGAAVHDPLAVLALTHPTCSSGSPGTSSSRPPASTPGG